MRKWYTPVLLVVLVLFVAFAGWWGIRMATGPLDPASACETTALTSLSTGQVQVRVYNAGTVKGQATTVANQLKGAGFVIHSTSNTDDDYKGTTIVGASGDDPQMQLVASFFPGATVTTDHRQNGLVDVVVTDDLGQGFKADAATSIDVPSGHACLPVAQPSHSATGGA